MTRRRIGLLALSAAFVFCGFALAQTPSDQQYGAQPPVGPPAQPPVSPPTQPPVVPPTQPPVTPPTQPPGQPPAGPPGQPPAQPPEQPRVPVGPLPFTGFQLGMLVLAGMVVAFGGLAMRTLAREGDDVSSGARFPRRRRAQPAQTGEDLVRAATAPRLKPGTVRCEICGEEFDPSKYQVVVPMLRRGFDKIDCAVRASALREPISPEAPPLASSA